MDIVKIQERIEKIREAGYLVDVFDLGVLPTGKGCFDVLVTICDDFQFPPNTLRKPDFTASGDTEFEAKAAAVKMFNVEA